MSHSEAAEADLRAAGERLDRERSAAIIASVSEKHAWRDLIECAAEIAWSEGFTSTWRGELLVIRAGRAWLRSRPDQCWAWVKGEAPAGHWPADLVRRPDDLLAVLHGLAEAYPAEPEEAKP